MCEEISYDEIYMPSEFDGDSNGNRTRQQSMDQCGTETQKQVEDDDREPGEVRDEQPKTATHPPKEAGNLNHIRQQAFKNLCEKQNFIVSQNLEKTAL